MVVTPEQRGRTGFVQLIERAAETLQQMVLLAIGREIFEFDVDRAQFANEPIELFARCGEELLQLLGRRAGRGRFLSGHRRP